VTKKMRLPMIRLGGEQMSMFDDENSDWQPPTPSLSVMSFHIIGMKKIYHGLEHK